MGFSGLLSLKQDGLLVYWCVYICFLEFSVVSCLFLCFSSFLSFWFCLFVPVENQLYDKADASTLNMTSLWD